MNGKIPNKIKHYYEGLIALFFPQFCVICNRELNIHDANFCITCKHDLHYTYLEKYKDSSFIDEIFWGRILLENSYSLLYYQKGNSTQKILHKIKYKDGKELGKFMGKMIGEKLKNKEEYNSIDAIIPIPLHSKKEFIRGYNQSELIAEGIHSILKTPILNGLYRKTHDESQTKKSKEERYENVKGKFGAKKEAFTNSKHILLVDDVLTTGSTLEFAAKAILDSSNNNCKISIATIAVAHQ